MADIREVIRDFLNFDIENEYYMEDKKEELAKQFKEILFEDDTTVRQFLKSVFENTETLARQYNLIASDEEVIEEPEDADEPEDAEEVEDAEEPEDAEEVEDAEEPEDAEEVEDAEEPEDSVEENVKQFYRRTAANILYD